MAVRTHTAVSGGQSRDSIKAAAPLGQVSLLESASDDQRPADSHRLQVAAEGPVHLLLFTGSKDTLDKGQQRWGQLGPSTLQEGQDPHAVSAVPLRDEQHRLQRRGSLQRSLGRARGSISQSRGEAIPAPLIGLLLPAGNAGKGP